MAVVTNFKFQGVDIGNYYGAKGASTAAATNFKFQNVDLNALLLALVDGNALGFNVNFLAAGNDLTTKFAVPTGNTPLPINGNSYAASANSGVVSSVANLVFLTDSTGAWSLSRTQSPGSSGTLASGTAPSGSTSCAYNLNVTSSSATGTSSSNSAPTQTAFSSSPTASIQANSTPSQPEHDISATLTIYYYNASNNIISTTLITLRASASGAS